jgi:hypothetical protein
MLVNVYEINLLHTFSINFINKANNNRTVKLSARVSKDHSMHKTLCSLLQSTRGRMEGNKETERLYDYSKQRIFLTVKPST